jgi:hypothetical protein
MEKTDKYRYTFRENDITVTAEKHTLIALAQALREAQIEGTWSDLVYQIEYEFDIDRVRSADEESDWDEEYIPSAENGDYSPSAPWNAPGCSIDMFININD